MRLGCLGLSISANRTRRPLRKVTFGAAIFMVVLLTTLLSLGFRQYQLLSRNEQIIQQSEKLLFQFATIREQITTTLIEQRYRQLPGIVPEVEEFHTNINRMVKNAHIPDEYKLSFINQTDLPGLILLLYKGGDPELAAEVIPQLNRESRRIGNHLMLFDRLLVNHAKRRMITFQSLVIGVLALSVFLIVNLLVLGHRRLATPIIELAGQVRQIHDGKRADLAITSPGGAHEVTELAAAFQNLLASRQQGNQEQGRRNRILYAIHRAGIACRQAISQETLFQAVGRALLFNEEYCLVWLGTPEKDGGPITPRTVAGAAAMDENTREKCLSVLLEAGEEQGEQNNPVARAVATGKPAIATDLLKEIPPVMLKRTILTGGYASCAALPLQWRRKIYGVLCLYSISRETFDDTEVELLAGLAGAMGLALHIFEEERQRSREQERTRTLLGALDSPLLTFSPQGEILSANATFSQLTSIPMEGIIGRHWLSIIQPSSLQEADNINDQDILASLAAADKNSEFLIRGDAEQKRLHGKITAIHDQDGTIREYACIGKTLTSGNTFDAQIGRQCQTVISELSAGVAHEISDLSNGIINYAQLLADNSPEQPETEEDRTILAKIITGGERIAEIVHKLIFYGQRVHVGGEYLPLPTVLDDAIMLIKHHLKTEGIQLDLTLSANSLNIPVNAQIMQQALINLFNLRRHALNRKYGDRDAEKRLAVDSTDFSEAGIRFYRITFTDCAEDLTITDIKRLETGDDSRLDPSAPLKELFYCRQLIESQNGILELKKHPDNEALSIQITFRVKG